MPIKPARRSEVRRRLAHETERFLFTAAFLAAFFVSVTTYRRLVLAEYGVSTLAYGWAVLKALITAKVILVGEALHLGERFRDRPLLVATLWKSLAFGVLVAVFVVAEHVLDALLHHRPVAGEFRLAGGRGYEMLARIQLEAVAFVPFFAFREL